MTPVSSHFQTIADPSLFIGIAMLAGSKRLIHYFPHTSKASLLISSIIASGAVTVYNENIYSSQNSYYRTVLEKTAVIALATFCSILVTQPIKGSLALSYSAAIKLGGLQCGLAAVAAYFNDAAPQLSTYNTYQKNPIEWRQLDQDKRTQLAKEFFDANQPGLCLYDAPINLSDFNPDFEAFLNSEALEIPDNIATLHRNKLSWLREVVQNNLDPLPPRKCFPLLELFQQHEIETVYFHNDITDFLQQNPNYLTVMQCAFTKQPIYEFTSPNVCALIKPEASFNHLASTLTVDGIEDMDPHIVSLWEISWRHDPLEKTLIDKELSVDALRIIMENTPLGLTWHQLDASIRSAFVKRFIEDTSTLDDKFCNSDLTVDWLNTWNDDAITTLCRKHESWTTKLIHEASLTSQLNVSTLEQLTQTLKAK